MSERNRATSSPATSQRRRSVTSRTLRRSSSPNGAPIISTSRQPSPLRTRSSSSEPTSFDWTLAIASTASWRSSGWMKSRPLAPMASSIGMPNTRSAARLAHRTRACASITNTASGNDVATVGEPAGGVVGHPTSSTRGLGKLTHSRGVGREGGPRRGTAPGGPLWSGRWSCTKTRGGVSLVSLSAPPHGRGGAIANALPSVLPPPLLVGGRFLAPSPLPSLPGLSFFCLPPPTSPQPPLLLPSPPPHPFCSFFLLVLFGCACWSPSSCSLAPLLPSRFSGVRLVGVFSFCCFFWGCFWG